MAEANLKAALDSVAHAQSVPDGQFRDAAQEALQVCGRSFRQTSKEQPELFDTVASDDAKIQTIKFLLRVFKEKPLLKSRVKECFKYVLDRSSWQVAAAKDEETKSSLIEFLDVFEDMSAIKKALEDGVVEETKDTKAPLVKGTTSTEQEGGDEESPDEITRRLIFQGLEGFRACDFVYPTGLHTEQASDDALTAFAKNFYLGVSRLNTAWSAQGSDKGTYEGIVQQIPDDDVPKIVNFLTTFWQARKGYRGQAKYVVDKLAEISPRFLEAVEARSGKEDRLPWLPELEEPAEEATPEFAGLPVRSMVPPGAICTVVWIDARKAAYEEAHNLKEGGATVVGFHDDWSSGFSSANEDALEYSLRAITSPDEHIIAIIVNNGPSHKQMLKDVTRHCLSNGRAPPWYLACTKGTYANFEDCRVTFVSPRREIVQAAALEELRIRQGEGHKFAVDQEVVFFSCDRWLRGTVSNVVGDGSVVIKPLHSDEEIPFLPQDFGSYVRAFSQDSVFQKLLESAS